MKPAHGVCCYKKGMAHIRCLTRSNDATAYICPDGTTTTAFGFCGRGDCNMFGCNCDGGCRDETRTLVQTLELYETKSGCTILDFHKY